MSYTELRLTQDCMRQLLTSEDFLSGAGNGSPREVRMQLEGRTVEFASQGIRIGGLEPQVQDGEFKTCHLVFEEVHWRLPERVAARLVRAYR